MAMRSALMVLNLRSSVANSKFQALFLFGYKNILNKRIYKVKDSFHYGFETGATLVYWTCIPTETKQINVYPLLIRYES